ncbi:heme/hemoglobin uptake outer membrane receptor PhuR [Ignatzschineria indica]|uniref:TonB-dependent hemoglobin/transferrin/lactoferrin family receptor n=1 Tax=Ignatzschineria indica TaxID=472583 RepID=A0A2U2AP24_9GAMM|nr:TonB-dependent hemoglobin/transferrin/lactoferrin family receptor [Ignatzschineria indica]PWD84964.1 TonB-dependent hemoglobin/transferrin/lactoferrin family receptor [Ignatzschineria indica]GGZ80442.1 heme/hemoglobin uptake outer membrane receptor PhuR [Ignatzschineria indica]
MTFKKNPLTIITSLLLISPLYAQSTPEWVLDNTLNAEGIAIPNRSIDNTPSVTLSKVIVSGALKEDLEIAESAATIAHFDTKNIDRLNATNLAQLLNYEPGVTVDLNKSGGISDIRIRGIGKDRVLISVDGAPIPMTYNFGSYLSTSRDYFDIDAMKSIDIIKGPMSTLYGGSALAGGIFMQTKDPSDFLRSDSNFGGEVKAGYRTATRETLLSGTVAGRFNDKLSAFARLTYTNPHEERNHAGKSSSEKTIGPNRTHPNKSEADTYNFLTKWVFEPNANHRFSLTYENFKESLHADPLSKINSVSFGTTYLDIHTKDVNKRQQVTLRHDFNQETALFDRGFWNIYFQDSKAKQDHNEMRFIPANKYSPSSKTTYRTRYSDFNNKTYGLGAEFTKGIAQNDAVFHNLTYGVNYRHNKVTTERDGNTINIATGMRDESETFPNKSFPDSKIKELGIFLQDRISFYEGQFEVIAGIRYDHYKMSPKLGGVYQSANPSGDQPASVSKSQFSKRVALLWHPTEENTLFFNYSEGFRAPSFSAINVGFGNPTHGYISKSNPNLKPESSKSYELGWNYIDNTKSFSATGFYTDYKNFIEERQEAARDPLTGYRVFQAINLDRSRIYGLELKGDIDLFTIQNGNGTIGINGSLAYAKGKEKGSNNPINNIEPLTATIGIDYNYLDNLYIGARLKAVKGKKAKDINLNEPSPYDLPQDPPQPGPGYATVDLIAEYKPRRDITINAGLYNIFNKEYSSWSQRLVNRDSSDLRRATNPGFNAALSVKYEF